MPSIRLSLLALFALIAITTALPGRFWKDRSNIDNKEPPQIDINPLESDTQSNVKTLRLNPELFERGSGAVFVGNGSHAEEGYSVLSGNKRIFYIGPFVLSLDMSVGSIVISHLDDPMNILWRNVPNKSFLYTGLGEDDTTGGYGSFRVIDHDHDFCQTQYIESVSLLPLRHGKFERSPRNQTQPLPGDPEPEPLSTAESIYGDEEAYRFHDAQLWPWIILRGRLLPCNVSYVFKLIPVGLRQLRFSARIVDPEDTNTPYPINGDVTHNPVPPPTVPSSEEETRVKASNTGCFGCTCPSDENNPRVEPPESYKKLFVRYEARPGEKFFGFGEQFTEFDMSGKAVQIFVREDGIGRSPFSPATHFLNAFGGDAGGNTFSTYMPLPYYMTNMNRSIFLENTDYSVFDFKDSSRVIIKVDSRQFAGRIIAASSPLDIIDEYTKWSGKMKLLPPWVHSGVVLGLQGGDTFVREIINKTLAAGVEVAAVWLQDWSGTRYYKPPLGGAQKRLWWNWESDIGLYKNWTGLVSDLYKTNGIRVLSYVNSFLADVSNKPNVRRNLFNEAAERGYLVQNATGKPYMISSGPGFDAGLVDLFNPYAFDWFKQVLKDQVVNSGVSGYMADFGEYLPVHSRIYTSRDARMRDHNMYPTLWAKLNHEVMEECGLTRDVVIFHRAAFVGAQRYLHLAWTGDQLSSSWDRFDGLKASLHGMLTSGMSGVSASHTDVGGYTSIPTMKRTRELLKRWMELGAFTAMFRTHEGSQPELNIQFFQDSDTLAHLAYCSKLFKALSAYRQSVLLTAAVKGYPLLRHPFLMAPNDSNFWKSRFEFFYGPDVFVAPVVHPRQRRLSVYLPRGTWMHLWTGKVFESKSLVHEYQGSSVTVETPLGQPAVFLKHPVSNVLLNPLIRFAKTTRPPRPGVPAGDNEEEHDEDDQGGLCGCIGCSC